MDSPEPMLKNNNMEGTVVETCGLISEAQVDSWGLLAYKPCPLWEFHASYRLCLKI